MSRIILVSSDPNLIREVTKLAQEKNCFIEYRNEWEEVDSNLISIKNDLPVGMKDFKTMDEVQSDTIAQALVMAGGNVSQVSKELGIGRATLYRKIKQYDISLEKARGRSIKKSEVSEAIKKPVAA